MVILLLIIITGILLCIIFCPCCACCPCNRQRSVTIFHVTTLHSNDNDYCRKRLIEKRYIISQMSATSSDMTLASNMQASDVDFPMYDNTGEMRRNSELAEIEEEVLMWQNQDDDMENIYEFTDDTNVTSGPIKQVYYYENSFQKCNC